MFTNRIKKIVLEIVTVALILSGIVAVPAFAFAKDNGNNKGGDKDNHGAFVSLAAHIKNDFKWVGDLGKNNNGNNKVNVNANLSAFVNTSIKPLAQTFSQSIQQATTAKKTADQTATANLKTSLSSATTSADVTADLQAYLNSFLTAFQTFATAKEDAFTAFINALNNVTTTTNQAPTANSQSISVNENSSVNVTLTGSDPENSALTFTVLTNPTNGTLSGTVPNLVYTPNVNFYGSDSFTFKVNDGSLNSNTATVYLTMGNVNQAPTANSQSVTVNENTSSGITLTGSDPQNHALTFALVTYPAHGTLSGTIPNLVYTPSTNYYGSDSFTFETNNGSFNSAVATVSITVDSTNQAPTANSQTVNVNENSSLNVITLTGSDPQNSALTFTLLTGPTHGILSGSVPNLLYSPATNFTGTDSFTFKVNDGSYDSAVATVVINVNP